MVGIFIAGLESNVRLVRQTTVENDTSQEVYADSNTQMLKAQLAAGNTLRFY